MPRWLVYSFLAVVLWGIWGVLGKATAEFSSGQSQAFSTLGILPVMLALAATRSFRESPRAWRGVAGSFVAGALVGIGNAAYYHAVSIAPASTTVSFTMLYPLVTILLALSLLRERPGPWQWLGIFGSLAAICLLGAAQPQELSAGRWLFAALACIALWGTASLVMKVATADATATQSTFWFLAAFVLLAAWILLVRPAYFVDRPIEWNLTARGWLALTSLGGAFGLGNLAVLGAYRHGGQASIVTPLTGLYPVVTIPLAIAFFGESVGRGEWAGIALALASAVCLMVEPKKTPRV